MPRFVGVIIVGIVGVNLAAWGLYVGLTPPSQHKGIAVPIRALPLSQQAGAGTTAADNAIIIPHEQDDTSETYIGATTSDTSTEE